MIDVTLKPDRGEVERGKGWTWSWLERSVESRHNAGCLVLGQPVRKRVSVPKSRKTETKPLLLEVPGCSRVSVGYFLRHELV